jgi:hypothetical protein
MLGNSNCKNVNYYNMRNPNPNRIPSPLSSVGRAFDCRSITNLLVSDRIVTCSIQVAEINIFNFNILLKLKYL